MPFKSESQENPCEQGERYPVPPKVSDMEWYHMMEDIIENGENNPKNMNFEKIREIFGDYFGRLWLQSEYEDVCRGQQSIRLLDSDRRDSDFREVKVTIERLIKHLIHTYENAFAETRWRDEAKKGGWSTHQEMRKVELVAKLLFPNTNNPLKVVLKSYARETLVTILQSAKFGNSHQIARLKGNEFVQTLGIRLRAINNEFLRVLTKEIPRTILDISDQDQALFDEICIHGLKSGTNKIRDNELINEKIAYNFTLLLLEDDWLNIHPGQFDDLLLLANREEDEINITKPYPSILYLSNWFYEMVHDNKPTTGKNSHAVFRWYSTRRDRWCYVEPEDHLWINEIISKPANHPTSPTEDELFVFDEQDTRHKNGGEGIPRGFLTTEGIEVDSSSALKKRISDGYTGHQVLRKLVSNRKFDPFSLGQGRRRGVPAKQNITALNNLQKTQWEINLDLLNVITTPIVHDSKLVKYELKAEIERPVNKESCKEWEDTILSDFVPKILVHGENVFWQVWFYDFRGRMFPRCTILSPQGSDMDRALLRFKEWKPLGERGWYWLRVHLFNLIAGKDIFKKKPPSKKLSFDKRVEWVDQHLNDYLKIAESPIEHHTEWQETPRSKGESLQRLAAMLEVSRVWKEHDGGKVKWDEISSGLAIQLDASNNGYQHLAALLRNKKLAESVNVILKPDADPDMPAQDLYLEVSTKVQEYWDEKSSKLSKKYAEDTRFTSERIKQICSRKLAKGITMTLAYGATDLQGIFMGNKNKKPEYRRNHYVLCKDSDDDKYVCLEHNEECATLKDFFDHVISTHSGVPKNAIIMRICESQIPDEAPSWGVIKLGYENSESRVKNHLRNLNSTRRKTTKGKDGKPKKVKDAPKVWVPAWHSDSLLASVFDVNEFEPKEQTEIATNLSKDYKKAVEEVTEEAFKHVETSLETVVEHSQNNIAMWTLNTGFRVRNFAPLFTNEPKWSADGGGTWTKYWGGEKDAKATRNLQEIFKTLEDLVGSEKADIDGVLCEAFSSMVDGKKNFKELENLYLRLTGKDEGMKEFVDKPWSISQEMGDKFVEDLCNKISASKTDARKVRLRLMNHLSNKKYNPRYAPEGTVIDEDDMAKYSALLRNMLISTSFSPGRFLPDLSKIDPKTGKRVAKNKRSLKGDITPNFVHSHDAAHMATTINTMFAHHGIQDFWAVHDCFAVHPSDTDALVEVVRQTFHKMYSEKSLEDWMIELNTPLPAKTDASSFDIDQIQESEYIIS